jgi:hypothetical protein
MYIYTIESNMVIRDKLDNSLIPPPPKNGHLTHLDPKLYIKCPPWACS